MSEQTKVLLLDVGNSYIKSMTVKESDPVFNQPLVISSSNSIVTLKDTIRQCHRVIVAVNLSENTSPCVWYAMRL